MYARGSNVYFYKIKVFDLGNDLVRTEGKDQMQPEGCKREVYWSKSHWALLLPSKGAENRKSSVSPRISYGQIQQKPKIKCLSLKEV